jgi:hypothetical protein
VVVLNATSSLVALRELEAEENFTVVRFGQSVVSIVTFVVHTKLS